MEAIVRRVLRDAVPDPEVIVEVLRVEMLLDPADFLSCEDKELRELGIPLGLVKRLKKEVEHGPQSTPMTGQIIPPAPVQPMKVNLPAPEAFFEDGCTSEEAKSQIILWMDEMKTSQSFLVASQQVKYAIFRLLQRIVIAILTSPQEEKYRKIKTDSQAFQKSLGQLEQRLYGPLLTSFGFEPVAGLPEMWYLRIAHIPLLKSALDHINQFAKETGAPTEESVQVYNPYQTQRGSTTLLHPTTGQALEASRERWKLQEFDSMQDRLRYLEDLFTTGGQYNDVPENLTVVQMDRIASGVFFTQTDEDEDPMEELQDLELEKLKMLISTKPAFRSRSRDIVKRLEKRKIYSTTRIRFVLVGEDSMAVEMTIHPAIKNQQLYAKIAKYLTDEDFELFTAPPVEILPPSCPDSLMVQNLIPNSLLRVRRKKTGGNKRPDQLKWINVEKEE